MTINQENASNKTETINTQEISTKDKDIESSKDSADFLLSDKAEELAKEQDEVLDVDYLSKMKKEDKDFDGFLTPEDIQALRDKHTNFKDETTEVEIAQDLDVENQADDKTPEDKDPESPDNTALPIKSEKAKTPAKAAKKEEVFAEEEAPMTLLEHLKEFRKRLTRVVLIVFIGFFVCYNFAELAYNLLALPLKNAMPEGSSFIYTSPPGAFFVYLKVSLVLSFFATSPYSFYQIWAFVAPGLYKEEKRMLIPLSFFSAFFFISGATFCYYLVFPIAFQFFMGFATDAIVPMISIEEYLSFVLKLLIAFGLVFEMPLFSFFLARLGLLTAQRMRKWRKYAVLVIFILAAILTPPDIFSQLLMALPMLVLYEVSVFIAALVAKKKEENNEENEVDEDGVKDEEEEVNNKI